MPGFQFDLAVWSTPELSGRRALWFPGVRGSDSCG
jgi:hypothetical protein